MTHLFSWPMLLVTWTLVSQTITITKLFFIQLYLSYLHSTISLLSLFYYISPIFIPLYYISPFTILRTISFLSPFYYISPISILLYFTYLHSTIYSSYLHLTISYLHSTISLTDYVNGTKSLSHHMRRIVTQALLVIKRSPHNFKDISGKRLVYSRLDDIESLLILITKSNMLRLQKFRTLQLESYPIRQNMNISFLCLSVCTGFLFSKESFPILEKHKTLENHNN